MDLKRLLKVYNYVNDPKRPKVNLKFMGLLAAFLVVGGLMILYAVNNPMAGPTSEPAAGNHQQKTAFVGLAPSEVSTPMANQALIDARWAAWQQAHPDAEVMSRQAQMDSQGRFVGWQVTYREPA
jgi:hypothetical protein